jgi:hypothetical protein
MTCLETIFAFWFKYFIPEVDGFSFIDVVLCLQATFVVHNDELTNFMTTEVLVTFLWVADLEIFGSALGKAGGAYKFRRGKWLTSGDSLGAHPPAW